MQGGQLVLLPQVWQAVSREVATVVLHEEANVLDLSWKCGGSTYSVLQAEDVPLILRNLTAQDIWVLLPLDIHSGEYKRVVHNYRQCTSPFRVSWSSLSVQDKIAGLDEPARHAKLQRVFDFLMSKADSDYKKFVLMQSRRLREPFPHKIFIAPEFQGVERALWTTLYHMRSLCESMLTGQCNRASGKV